MESFLSKFLRKAVIVFSIAIMIPAAFIPVIVALNVSLPVAKVPVPLMILNVLLVITLYYLIYSCYKNRYILKKKFALNNIKGSLINILIVAFLLRLIWILIVPTIPASDFALMFDTGKKAALGDYSIFKGNSYFARFSHDIITVLYFSFFYIFSSPLTMVKILNVVFQTFSVYGLFLLIKELYDERKAIIGAGILAVFPPFVMFTSEVMSENVAIPLYILSCYFLLKGIKKNFSNFIVSGFLLSIASMIRKVGEVFLVAYIVFLLIYIMKEKKLRTVLAVVTLIVTFALPLYLTSSLLLKNGIIERQLWNGKEPQITSILKGSNLNGFGGWNKEDAEIVERYNYDFDKIKEVSKATIKERLTKNSPILVLYHYIAKDFVQWGSGDFDSCNWTLLNVKEGGLSYAVKTLFRTFYLYSEIFYGVLLALTYIGTKSKSNINKNKTLNLFYILLGGFVLLYTISETQSRYSFVVSWVFIIFAVEGLERLFLKKSY